MITASPPVSPAMFRRIQYRVRITGDITPLVRAMDGPIERLRMPRKLLEQRWSPILRAAARDRFAEGGYPAWKELAPSTIREKSRLGLPARTAKGRIPRRLMQRGGFGPQNILIRTGAGRDSWVQKNARGHWEQVKIDEGKTAELQSGTSIDYMGYHQTGAPARSPRARIRAALKGRSGSPLLPRKTPSSSGRGGLPRRPVTFAPRDIDALRGSAEQFFAGKDVVASESAATE